MRYRALSPTGDFTFGQGSANYLVNSPAAVGQAVITRLKLLQGEWFLDTTAGMPWSTEVFVEGGKYSADQAARACILGTQGVSSIVSYSSSFSAGRAWAVNATIMTIYGETSVSVSL
jgi:hypothetical protein